MSCDAGTRVRFRSCDSPTAEGSGAACDGSDTEIGNCGEVPCPCELYSLFLQKIYCAKCVIMLLYTVVSGPAMG